MNLDRMVQTRRDTPIMSNVSNKSDEDIETNEARATEGKRRKESSSIATFGPVTKEQRRNQSANESTNENTRKEPSSPFKPGTCIINTFKRALGWMLPRRRHEEGPAET